MSFNSPTIIDNERNNDNNVVVTYHHRNTHHEPTALYTSSIVVDLRQLQTDLHAQHQHQKGVLTELNQRFHLFVDRIQLLQAQNSKYLAAIADLRRRLSGTTGADIHWDEHSFSIQSNLSALSHAKIDVEWDIELFQLQIAIYRHLIDAERQWKDKRSLILEDELKQSTSVLATLRANYVELQRKIESLYGEGDNLFKQYLTMAHDWCVAKKQRKKCELNMKTLKSYTALYKNLRPNSTHNFNSLSIQSDDLTQFWKMELDKIMKRIRHDFEAFYASIHRDTITYYETKLEETEREVKQASKYRQTEFEEFAMILQTHQMEYEKVHKNLSYEKEILAKLQTTYSQLEAEYKSIQLHHEERLEVQSRESNSIQEHIMIMVYDVDEIRRSKTNLEAEIIVYRNLLDTHELGERIAIDNRIQPIGNEMMGKFVVKKQKKRWIGIKECVPDGKYISLMNHSTNKDIDISRWVLKQHIDSGMKLRYTIPNGVRLERGNELRIYAKHSDNTTVELSSYQKLVNKDIVSWGMGNKIETILFNQNGDEEASYSQSAVFRRDTVL